MSGEGSGFAFHFVLNTRDLVAQTAAGSGIDPVLKSSCQVQFDDENLFDNR